MFRHVANAGNDVFPHGRVLSVVSEHIGEHALGLIGIRQVHDDARPLFGKRLIGFRIDSSVTLGFLTEVVEGLTDGVLVATVGKLAVEDRVVAVNAHLFLAVGENTEFPNR